MHIKPAVAVGSCDLRRQNLFQRVLQEHSAGDILFNLPGSRTQSRGIAGSFAMDHLLHVVFRQPQGSLLFELGIIATLKELVIHQLPDQRGRDQQDPRTKNLGLDTRSNLLCYRGVKIGLPDECCGYPGLLPGRDSRIGFLNGRQFARRPFFPGRFLPAHLQCLAQHLPLPAVENIRLGDLSAVGT